MDSNVFKLKLWGKLYRKLIQAEILLRKQNFIVTKRMRYFYCEILFLFLIFLSLHGYTFYINIRDRRDNNLSVLIGGALAHFYMNFLLILTCNLAQALKRRFNYLNQMIVHISEEMFSDKMAINKMNEVITLYRTLYLVMDNFNRIFGWHIFFYISLTVIRTLVGVVRSMEFKFSLESNTSNYVSCMVYIMSCIVLIMCCDTAEKSGKKSIKICFTLHERSEREIIKEQLLQLADYAQYWRPTFSAAGFYDVNQSTFTAIFNAFITYIVILIQFTLALRT
nr:gustatory receptor [Semanotus bifasciatus]